MSTFDKFPWFRMHHEIIEDEKIGQLAFEDRWHFIALLCLKCKGKLDQYAPGARLDNCVGYKLGLGDTDRDRLRTRLVDAELITPDWQPISWEGRQYVKSDHDAAQRMRESRARKSDTQPLRNSDVTVPHRSAASHTSVFSSSSLKRREDKSQEEDKSFLQKIVDRYPKNSHSMFVSYLVLSMLESLNEEESILEGIDRYAKYCRHEGIEDTKFVKSLNKFLQESGWKQEWALTKKDPEATQVIDADRLQRIIRGEEDV